MSYPARKLVRDAVKTALADVTYGFNAKLAAIASTYGVTAWTFNFSAGSSNFLQAYLGGEDVDMTQIATFPAMLIYTTGMQQSAREKLRTFSGNLICNIDIYLQYAYRLDGVSFPEQDDIEKYSDAVSDVLTEIFQRRALAWPAGVSYSYQFQFEPDPAIPLADGWRQRLACQLAFQVNL
jgi:hypothetical protein